MAILELDESVLLVFSIILLAMGVMASQLAARFKAMSLSKIAEVYELRNGLLMQVERIGLGPGVDDFHVGEKQFVVDNEKISSYEKWNRWGGRLPVIRYNLQDARPGDYYSETKTPALTGASQALDQKKKDSALPIKSNSKKASPKDGPELYHAFGTWYHRITKPSSATTNWLFRRGGAKQIVAGTKQTSGDLRTVAIAVGIACFAVGYLVFNFYHPGLIPGPPAGYEYHAIPIPSNVTVIHG